MFQKQIKTLWATQRPKPYKNYKKTKIKATKADSLALIYTFLSA
jgi:hypothetical protein